MKLLTDGDEVAFRVASAVEQAIEWEGGLWTWHCDINEVKDGIISKVRYLEETYSADVVLCLTDSGHTFRHNIHPGYKGNRTQKRPLVLKAVKEWMVSDLGAYFRPGLEADDCMGILQTWARYDFPTAIWSSDKDMKQVPGHHADMEDEDLTFVEREEADAFFYAQVLSGDPTDGFEGCPGWGFDRAREFVREPWVEFPFWHQFKSGQRKGQFEERACRVPYDGHPWPAIVERYCAAYDDPFIAAESALQNARLARILRAEDYNFKQKKVKLWTPPK